MKRSLSIVLLLTLLSGWLPPEAFAVDPPRLPQETVAWSSSRLDSAYTLQMYGAGYATFSRNFASPEVQPICLTWYRPNATLPWVQATWRSMQLGGRVLAGGGEWLNGYNPTEIGFRTVGGVNISMPWRTMSIVPFDTPNVCFVPWGHQSNTDWVEKAVVGWKNADLSELLNQAAVYWLTNVYVLPRDAESIGVRFERRPSFLVITGNAFKTRINVLQEPLANWGCPDDMVRGDGGIMEPVPVLASVCNQRWREFRFLAAVRAGINESVAMEAITKREAASAAHGLLTAAGASRPLVLLTVPADLAKITVPDAPTATKIKSMLAAGITVLATKTPVTYAGWTGTAWYAVDRNANAGAYLGTLAGAEGASGIGTQAQNEAVAHGISDMGKTIGIGVGLASLGIGLVGSSGGITGLGFGTVGYAVGVIGMTAIGLGLGVAVVGLAIGIAMHFEGQHGQVGLTMGTTGLVASAQSSAVGTEASTANGGVNGGGPAGSAPAGPPGSPSSPPSYTIDLTITPPSNDPSDGFSDPTDSDPGEGTGDGW